MRIAAFFSNALEVRSLRSPVLCVVLPAMAIACGSGGSNGLGNNDGGSDGSDGGSPPTTDASTCTALAATQLPFCGDPCKSLQAGDFAPYGASIGSAQPSTSDYTQACKYTLAYQVPASGAVGTACTRVQIDPACNFALAQELAQGESEYESVPGLGDAAYFYDQAGPNYVVKYKQYQLTVFNQTSCHVNNTVGCSPDTMDARAVALALAHAIVSRL
jgi:hypothetical protein